MRRMAPAFVGEVERKRCACKVRIISGTEEARLSAQGVLSGIPGADGIMGDLGGGSLELVGARTRAASAPMPRCRWVRSA